MNRLTLTTLAALGLLAPAAALAQPTQPTQPPPPPADGSLDDDTPDVNRPLARARACERRDLVEELLKRPGSLSSAAAVELAEDLGIPKAHAEKLIAEAKRNGDLMKGGPRGLIELGVPEGKTLPPGDPNKITNEQLKAAGWTEAEMRTFNAFRRSAWRVYRHFREVKAIEEARNRGSELFREKLNTVARGTPLEKARAVASVLGVKVELPAVEELLGRARSAENRAAATRREAGATGTDPLVSFRRADGTLDWGRLTRSQLFGGASGVAHFAFAMFLKEFAIVLKTGDSRRLEEFVDGLMSTDFFVNYGLFAAGAKTADAAYGAYVRRLTRKRFLSGVVRSNLVLAAGLAVPMVARGKWDLDTYLVDVAALGLSATAVKGAVEGVKGVYKLVRGSRPLINLGRLAGPAGWVYTAGETAVVLLIGDELARRFDRWMDERELRGKVQDAQGKLEELIARHKRGETISPSEIARALSSLETSYDDLRRNKLAPMDNALAEFNAELNESAREAAKTDTATAALSRHLENNPALRRHVEGTGYAERLRERREATLEADLRSDAETFEREWNESLRTGYTGETTPENPAPAPDSRLGLYDEETDALLRALDSVTDPTARDHIALAISRVRLKRAMDRAILRSGETGASAPANDAPTPGMTGRVPGQ